MIVYNKAVYKYRYGDSYVIPIKIGRKTKEHGTSIICISIKTVFDKPGDTFKWGKNIGFNPKTVKNIS